MGTRVTWAWLAGFTDGDGCIFIPEKATRRPSQIRVTWYQRSSDGWLIEEIEEFLSQFFVECRRYVHSGSKISGDVIHLTVAGRTNIQLVLEELEPHLVLKQGKAIEALRLLQFRPPSGATWRNGKCKKGHDVSLDENVYISPKGIRSCRTCRRLARVKVVK